MKRQLQRSVFIPANRTILYDLEKKNLTSLEKKIVQTFYKTFFHRIFNIKSTRKISDPLAYDGNNMIYNDLWKTLYDLVHGDYLIILYPNPNSDINEQELNERFRLMYEKNLVNDLIAGNRISDFEKAIEKYNINPFNSGFIATDPNILNAFCDRFYPRHSLCGRGVTYGHTYFFDTIFWNDSFPESGLKYPVPRSTDISTTLIHLNYKYYRYSGGYIPFLANKFIYLEEFFDPDANQFILDNYDQINKIANNLGYEFIYFPKFVDKVKINSFINDFINYYHPSLDVDANQLPRILKSKIDWNKHILKLLNLPKLQYPAIIKTDERRLNINPQELIFNYLRGDYKKAFNDFLGGVGEAGKDPVLLYQLKKKEKEHKNTADDVFQEEAHSLANDVVEKINYMKSHGMESLVAEIALRLLSEMDDKSLKKLGVGVDNNKQLAKEIEQPKISRLCIEWTSKYDFQISLPDYGNMVVDMPRLPKAVFLFFLNHPEGVLFSNLSEYKHELLQIYSRISNLSNTGEIKANVERLIDPLDNSINVNCSRIKSAFVKLIDDRLAQYYYIQGWRGEPKTISLPREKVDIINPWD